MTLVAGHRPGSPDAATCDGDLVDRSITSFLGWLTEVTGELAGIHHLALDCTLAD